MEEVKVAEFSPGPWSYELEIRPPTRCFRIRAGGREVANYLAFDDHKRFQDECTEPERVEANARLIAAAPTMLAALERLLGNSSPGSLSQEQALASARSAIRAARGGE